MRNADGAWLVLEGGTVRTVGFGLEQGLVAYLQREIRKTFGPI